MIMMKKAWGSVWVSLLLVGILGLMGCGQKTETKKEGADSKQSAKQEAKADAGKGKKTFVMVPKVVMPYYEPCFEGFKDAAAKYGAEVEYLPPNEMKLPLQVKVIEDLIARKVDGIAISALDDIGLKQVINDAMAAGIKVVTFDAPAPSSNALSYIGTINEAAGAAAAEEMIKTMGGEGELAILQGGLVSSNLNQRFEGFKKTIETKAPNIKIVAREDTEGKIDTTVAKVEALLQVHPNLKAFFGVSATDAPGAAIVIEEQKKVGKILIGGFDDTPDTLSAIRKGTVSFALAQQTYKMGWLSVVKLCEAIEGKTIEKEINTGLLVVTKENVDSYMSEMKANVEKSDAAK